MPATKKSPPARKPAKSPPARMTLKEVMASLEKAGSAQTRKTYARHRAPEPMFGVSFADLKLLMKRIRVDHELACALWETGNFDARNLAVKVVDPARMSPADLDRWARTPYAPMCHDYVAAVAAESPHGRTRADAWLASRDEGEQRAGWSLVAALAMRDETIPDSWFEARLATIEESIKTAPNDHRTPMNQSLIAIGGRSAALRKTALAAAKRIGDVDIDMGDTYCKQRDAAEYIHKMWSHAEAKKFASPSAQERARETMRTRC